MGQACEIQSNQQWINLHKIIITAICNIVFVFQFPLYLCVCIGFASARDIDERKYDTAMKNNSMYSGIKPKWFPNDHEQNNNKNTFFR